MLTSTPTRTTSLVPFLVSSSSSTSSWLLLLAVLLSGGGRGRSATGAAVFPTAEEKGGRLTCSEALHHFLANLSRSYNSIHNSLTVEGGAEKEEEEEGTTLGLHSNLRSICGTDAFSLELWRAITVPNAALPPDFGTREYFSKYQNCDNPNPDLLWKHGDSVTATVGRGGSVGSGGVSGLRSQSLRPAAMPASSSSNTMEKVVFYHVVEQQYILRICPCSNHSAALPCSCEHASLHGGGHIGGGGGSSGGATCSEIFNISNPYREKVFPWCRGDGTSSIPAPRPQLSAPKLQHCPAQVMISGTLPSCTPVRDYDQVEVVLQPMAYEVEDCKELPREASGRLAKLAPLTAINDTHGMFHVAIGNITHETYYCLRVELVNHPYCNSASDHTLTRQSAVCRAVSLKKPIFIEDHVCGRPDPCEPPKPNLPLITGMSLAAAVFLAVTLVVCHRLVCRRRRQAGLDSGIVLGADHRLLLLGGPVSPQHPDVFFLYWGDSGDFVEVNRLVGRWLTGLGHKVIDLADELVQEEMAACPEAWLTDRLAEPSLKVIVVESELANECLRLDATVAVDDIYHHETAAMLTNTISGAQSNGSVHNRHHHHKKPPLVRDSVDELRAYSLRYIHAQLATNYRRLSVVQYRPPDDDAAGGPLGSLVPHTRHTLPEHLAELQAWLADTQAWDDNSNLGASAREQTLRDLKAAVQKYTAARSIYKYNNASSGSSSTAS